MVQRLSLFGTVAVEEKPMLTRCLKSISGMNPRNLEVERQIWSPKFRFDTSRLSTSSQPTQTLNATKPEQYRLFVVKSDNSLAIETYEIPEAGKNIKVVSQAILSAKIAMNDDNLAAFMEELGCELQSTHYLKGDQYVLHDHIVVNLFQIYDAADNLLDNSGQHTIITYVDIDSVRDLSAVERGTQMLLTLQQELRGVATLQVPNRNAFTTRIPRQQQFQE